jgi:protein gp37
MAENSKIEWTDHTFNPWIGCTKVSPACKNCYAERDFDQRFKQVQWGPNGTRVLTSNENWAKPLKWNRDIQKEYEVAQAQWVADCCVGTKSYPEPELHQFRKRVFCASLADVFEDWQGPILNSKGERGVIDCNGGWWFTNGPVSNCYELTMDVVRQRLFALIDATPNLDWLLLTKRPENVLGLCMWPIHPSGKYQEGMSFAESHGRSNVWLGTSVENQEYADKRIPELLKCRDLSPVLFLSCEPLLGPIDLSYPDSLYPDGPAYCCSGFECGCRGLPIDPPAYLNKAFGGVDWVIAGGESGPEARPSNPNWFRSLRNQCESSSVPFLFKQWGEFGENLEQRVGKVRAGRSLDGVTHDGFPVQS